MKNTTASLPLRLLRFARVLRLAPAFLLLPACSSSNNASDAGGNATGNVIIKDANNYTSTSALTIPVIQTAAATDLTIDWSGIKKDLLCHTAESIDNVAFLKIGNMTQADVEAKLAQGKLTSTQVTTYKEFHTANAAGDGGALPTSTMLSKLSFGSALAPATDYTESATTQYLLLFTHGTTLGVGAQSMVFIQPSSSSQNVTVTAPDACASDVLSFMPTLSSMPVSIPTAGPWKVDWSEITKDNFGNPLDFSQTKLDEVELGFFMGKQPSDVQADFLNVELDATDLYTYSVPLGQKYIDLAGAEADGGTFPGFTSTNGTWAVAVLCSTCSVPAPIVFATLAPQ
ncbi:MAG TPA: hypothetical protein VHG72_12220 [Polyangia bacterium]|nr:hypothetical protein [Polyangia bacterium]